VKSVGKWLLVYVFAKCFYTSLFLEIYFNFRVKFSYTLAHIVTNEKFDLLPQNREKYVKHDKNLLIALNIATLK